jgi:F-type H+-transporting ATPase subunit gamma
VKREAELRRRLHVLRALRETIGAMKSLSAHHLRATRAAVAPAREYRAATLRILQGTQARLAAGSGEAGLLVIGAELGLCGAYNAQVARAASERRLALGPGPTSCVGQRAASLLARHGVGVQRTYPGPTSVNGITELLLRVAEDLLTQYVTQYMSSFSIVSSHFGGVGSAAVESVCLLPVRASEGAAAAVARYATPEQLGDASVREFLYITLYESLLDALAAEHSARLLATQAAERWLEERTQRLERSWVAARRESSTQEVLEIAAGARARRR